MDGLRDLGFPVLCLFFFFCGSFFLGGGNWGLGFVCCILQAREIGAMKQIERANIL